MNDFDHDDIGSSGGAEQQIPLLQAANQPPQKKSGGSAESSSYEDIAPYEKSQNEGLNLIMFEGPPPVSAPSGAALIGEAAAADTAEVVD